MENCSLNFCVSSECVFLCVWLPFLRSLALFLVLVLTLCGARSCSFCRWWCGRRYVCLYVHKKSIQPAMATIKWMGRWRHESAETENTFQHKIELNCLSGWVVGCSQAHDKTSSHNHHRSKNGVIT